jgi:hypothetical protein
LIPSKGKRVVGAAKGPDRLRSSSGEWILKALPAAKPPVREARHSAPSSVEVKISEAETALTFIIVLN